MFAQLKTSLKSGRLDEATAIFEKIKASGEQDKPSDDSPLISVNDKFLDQMYKSKASLEYVERKAALMYSIELYGRYEDHFSTQVHESITWSRVPSKAIPLRRIIAVIDATIRGMVKLVKNRGEILEAVKECVFPSDQVFSCVDEFIYYCGRLRAAYVMMEVCDWIEFDCISDELKRVKEFMASPVCANNCPKHVRELMRKEASLLRKAFAGRTGVTQVAVVSQPTIRETLSMMRAAFDL